MNISEEGVKPLKTVQIIGDDSNHAYTDEQLTLIAAFSDVLSEMMITELKGEEIKVPKKES